MVNWLFEYLPCLKGIKTDIAFGFRHFFLFEYLPCLKGIKTYTLINSRGLYLLFEYLPCLKGIKTRSNRLT